MKLGKFYMRRIIRLYPALLFMLYVSACLYMLLGFGHPSPMEVAAGVGYFTNVFQVFSRIGGELPFMPWTHLWSLAVEEHFYLGFPVLIILFRKNWRGLALTLGWVISAAFIWRSFINFGTNLPAADYNYMMTDARIAAVGLSFFVAAFSFYYVEKPFIALRRKYGSHAGNGEIPSHPGVKRLTKMMQGK